MTTEKVAITVAVGLIVCACLGRVAREAARRWRLRRYHPDETAAEPVRRWLEGGFSIADVEVRLGHPWADRGAGWRPTHVAFSCTEADGVVVMLLRRLEEGGAQIEVETWRGVGSHTALRFRAYFLGLEGFQAFAAQFHWPAAAGASL